MGQILNFKESILSIEWKKKYDDLMYRFHELYEDCDKCLEEAYKLYGEVLENKDFPNIYLIKIVHFIANARTERIVETGEKDLDAINFIRYYKNLLRDEYRIKQLEWMEAKCLSLNSDSFLNSAIHIYINLVDYFSNLLNKSDSEEELVKQTQNLGALNMELGEIFKRKGDKFSSIKYSSKSINIYINLYLDERVSKNELKNYYNRFKKITEFNNDENELNRIDEILVSNEIAL